MACRPWLLATALSACSPSTRGPLNDRIDDAYREKYAGSPYLDPMVGPRARAATVKVLPRGAKA